MRRTLLIFSVLMGFSLPSLASDEVLAIIVSPEQSIKTLSKSELSLIFWRKKLYWANHKRIRPINLSTEHPLRQNFSARVLKSLPEQQTDYWNGLYYHGVLPPHVVNSSEAMLRTVAETAGAIGYVSACEADSRVKVLAWLNADGQVVFEAPNTNCQSE